MKYAKRLKGHRLVSRQPRIMGWYGGCECGAMLYGGRSRAGLAEAHRIHKGSIMEEQRLRDLRMMDQRGETLSASAQAGKGGAA